MKNVRNMHQVTYSHNGAEWKPGEILEVNDYDAECFEKQGFEIVQDEIKDNGEGKIK